MEPRSVSANGRVRLTVARDVETPSALFLRVSAKQMLRGGQSGQAADIRAGTANEAAQLGWMKATTRSTEDETRCAFDERPKAPEKPAEEPAARLWTKG